jgi:hypothetical protein
MAIRYEEKSYRERKADPERILRGISVSERKVLDEEKSIRVSRPVR